MYDQSYYFIIEIIGTDGNGLKTALENLVNNRNPQLGKYMPCSSGEYPLSLTEG